jgi:Mg-chelatase subunit ChlI
VDFYVDEVNLLDDHLVDILLDSASGWNTVEREESLSSARFVLVDQETRKKENYVHTIR